MSEEELIFAMYLHLFNAVTDALSALEEGQGEAARQLLLRGQQDCEEMFLRGQATPP